MDWTTHEAADLLRKFYDVANVSGTMEERRALVCGFADDVVAMVLTRGGTMTAEQVTEALECIREDEFPSIQEHLRQHIAAQGATVASLGGMLREAMDAARALGWTGSEEQGGPNAVGRWFKTTVATLQAKVAEMEKTANDATAHWKGLADGWQADALKAGRERDAARAEVERLKAELAEVSPYQEMWEAATRELGALSSKAETVRAMWKERADAAESRLAASRARLKDMAEEDDTDAPVSADFKAGWHAARKHASEALEGDAPQDDTSTRGDYGGELREEHEDAPQAARADNTDAERPPTIAELEEILNAPEGTYKVEVQPDGQIRAVKRYPCSPTCTHDDAANPGHPERVKERSEAFGEVVDAARDMDVRTNLLQRAYDNGAEAMRAACLDAVLRECGVFGLSLAARESFKAAIEGAAP